MIEELIKEYPEVINNPNWWVDNWDEISFDKKMKFMEIIGRYEGRSNRIDKLIYNIKTKLGK